MTRIATSALRPAIYLAGGRDKREATDDVLLAVADYTLAHFGGHLKAAYRSRDGGPDLTIEVRVIESAPQGGAETPADDLRDVPEAPMPSDRRTAPPEGMPAPKRDLDWFIANAPEPDETLTVDDFTPEAISRDSREAHQRRERERDAAQQIHDHENGSTQ